MKVKELTYKEDNSLNNLIKVFQALTLNCEVKENTSQFDILSQICYDLRPKILIHSYSFSELVLLLKAMSKSKITGYEIITSVYGLGMLDIFDIDAKDILHDLKKNIKKSFKYFFFGELEGEPILVSYNPLLKYKDIVEFVANEELQIKCHFVQIGDVALKRSLNILQSKEEGNCKLITYQLE